MYNPKKEMDMKYKILFIAFVALFVASCYNEDALTPTIEPEPEYLLPQGNHDYDARIVDWNRRCGFYVLYQFNPQDVYWNLTAWEGISWNEANQSWNQSTFKALPAEEAYAGKQLDLLEEEFLNCYPDSVLRQWMPLKLLLCSVLWKPNRKDSVDMPCRGGFDYIAVNYGNSTIGDLKSAEIDAFRSNLHATFLKKAIDSKKGFLKAYNMFTTTIQSDWADYVTAIVSNNTEYLESFSRWDMMSSDWWTSSKGILNENKDGNGLVRKKYDIVIKHFKEVYGVDLQNIGDRNQ